MDLDNSVVDVSYGKESQCVAKATEIIDNSVDSNKGRMLPIEVSMWITPKVLNLV